MSWPLIVVNANNNAGIKTVFVRWNGMRAFLHNGWWLVTSLYLVIEGGLTASQLVLIGVVQGVAGLLFEIPAGILADTISRKWSIVLSQLLMGLSMLGTGLVKSFALLMVTQILWGVSWSFVSGADTAWVSDELNEPQNIRTVLTRATRAQLCGAMFGIVIIGLLAWLTSLRFAMVTSGLAMFFLGLYVIICFPERHFVPARRQQWVASWEILKEGIVLVKKSQTIMVVFLATFLCNGAADSYSRLFPK